MYIVVIKKPIHSFKMARLTPRTNLYVTTAPYLNIRLPAMASHPCFFTAGESGKYIVG